MGASQFSQLFLERRGMQVVPEFVSIFCVLLCTFCLHVTQVIFVLHHQPFAWCVPMFPLHLCQHFLHLTYSVAVCSIIYESEKQNFRLHCKAQCYHVPRIRETVARKLYFWHLGLQHTLCIQNTK